VHDLDEGDEDDTVTMENPAYDNSFSHKGFKVHATGQHDVQLCMQMHFWPSLFSLSK